MAKNKIYAVRVGRKKGLYSSWEECEKQIKGFSNSEYKGFDTTEEATEYLNICSKKAKKKSIKKTTVKKKYKKKSFGKRKEVDETSNSPYLYYKDKPVNGDPTDKQIDFLKALGKQKNLEISIIGINRKEAAELINYLVSDGLELKKPACFKRYVKQT